MYILTLCLRYLRTRYIALASIISVMLGVATMIVVNSVMSGFSNEMQARIHGILGDVILESYSSNGFSDAEGQLAKIRNALGDDLVAATPICTTAGIMSYRVGGMWATKEVIIIGIDPDTKGEVGDFSNYLQHPENREKLSFQLREDGYDVYDHQAARNASERTQMLRAGWTYRRDFYRDIYAEVEGFGPHSDPATYEAPEGSSVMFQIPPPPPELDAVPESLPENLSEAEGLKLKAPEPETGKAGAPLDTRDMSAEIDDPFGAPELAQVFDPLKDQHAGAIVGIGLTMRRENGVDYFHFLPGNDFKLTFPTCTTPPTGITAHFTCVDLYESKMSEYDNRFVFLPLEQMQKLRGMADPDDPRMNRVNQIQIKVREGVDLDAAKRRVQAVFDPDMFCCYTWRDNQIALLQAVEFEIAILNVLLFLIIAVSGFGILAIFFMIVSEKTRDIGILKALGASSGGVMGIFLMYGLSLGIVGAGMGMLMGLLFVWNINQIAAFLGWMLGRPVFDPDIYYFYQIPFEVSPWTVTWIVGGTLMIAVLASVFPAWRAARLQPVEALRHE